MLSANKVDIKLISDRLKSFYAEDPELIEKYHQCAGKSLQECVDKTAKIILGDTGTSLFIVKNENGVEVGYYTEIDLHDNRFVMSYFVRPEFRKKQILIEFWNLVGKKGIFYTSVSEKNTRAAEHLKKNGFEYLHDITIEGVKWSYYKH